MFLDINECMDNTLNNCTDSDKMICQNTMGSYNCSCEEGYSLDNNGETCVGKYNTV